MKKIFKSRIFAFILGGLVIGSIGVVSAYSLLASNVGFQPKDTTWQVDNVKDAIDGLYTELSINGADLIVNKQEWVTSVSFTPSNDYRYYVLTDVFWYTSQQKYSDCANNSNIKSISNATYIDIGLTGRNTGVSSGAAHSFLIKTENNSEIVNITFNSGADSASVYGIK